MLWLKVLREEDLEDTIQAMMKLCEKEFEFAGEDVPESDLDDEERQYREDELHYVAMEELCIPFDTNGGIDDE